MITSKVLLPLLGVSAALLMTACATAPEPLPEKISGPSEFIDDSVKELYRNVDKVYTTEYFALGIPTGWKWRYARPRTWTGTNGLRKKPAR